MKVKGAETQSPFAPYPATRKPIVNRPLRPRPCTLVSPSLPAPRTPSRTEAWRFQNTTTQTGKESQGFPTTELGKRSLPLQALHDRSALEGTYCCGHWASARDSGTWRPSKALPCWASPGDGVRDVGLLWAKGKCSGPA